MHVVFIVFQHVTEDVFIEYPFWYRFFYMFAVFTIFRFRLYFAWIMSEVVCMNAALGAYPTASRPKCGQGPTDLKALDNRFVSSTRFQRFSRPFTTDLVHTRHIGYEILFSILYPSIFTSFTQCSKLN